MPYVSARLGARSLVAAAAIACCALLPGRALASVTLSNWDSAQQRQVIKAGLMSNLGRSFQGGSTLSASQANSALQAVTSSERLRRSSSPVASLSAAIDLV